MTVPTGDHMSGGPLEDSVGAFPRGPRNSKVTSQIGKKGADCGPHTLLEARQTEQRCPRPKALAPESISGCRYAVGRERIHVPASKLGVAAVETAPWGSTPSDTRPLSELHGCFKKKKKLVSGMFGG